MGKHNVADTWFPTQIDFPCSSSLLAKRDSYHIDPKYQILSLQASFPKKEEKGIVEIETLILSVMCYFCKSYKRGTWVAQSGEHQTLDLSSGLDLRISGLQVQIHGD